MCTGELNDLLRKHLYKRLPQEEQDRLLVGLFEYIYPITDEEVRDAYMIRMVEYVRDPKPISSKIKKLYNAGLGLTYLEIFDSILIEEAINDVKNEYSKALSFDDVIPYCEYDMDSFIYCKDIIEYMLNNIEVYRFICWYLNRVSGYTAAEIKRYFSGTQRHIGRERVRQLVNMTMFYMRRSKMIEKEDKDRGILF